MNLVSITVQLIFAAFCFIAASYVGNLRHANENLAATSAIFDETHLKAILSKVKITSVIFDLAILGLVVSFAIFLHEPILIFPFILIYRLFYGCFLNYFEGHALTYLDPDKNIDGFIIKIVGQKAGGWIQILILVAFLITFNILF